MPWCPKCGNEYVEGIKVCADCKVELVDELEAESEAKEELLYNFTKSLEDTDESESDMQQLENKKADSSYENKTEKAENYKSSAYTLIGVGVVGIIILILCFIKIIPFQISLLTYVVMGILFILFFVFGIHAYQSYKNILVDAENENITSNEIREWCKKNLIVSDIDAAITIESDSDEVKYFKRTQYMKECLEKEFKDTEDGLLDVLIEEIYCFLYEMQ